MAKTYKKQVQEENVLEAALERLREVYRRYDEVVVSFSGGKDSTVTLNLAIIVATEFGRLPVKAMFVDEEALHPPTIEYIRRVYNRPDVDLTWYCLPVEHRNACSRKQPFWYTWNPADKDIWCRELPEEATTELEGFKFGMTVRDVSDLHMKQLKGQRCSLLGLRADESIRRRRAVSFKIEDNYISKPNKAMHNAFPIYDFNTPDVWRCTKYFGWDYNHTYDVFEKSGRSWHGQRVCPPFGEEPLRGLWMYAQCFPELWHKMLNRVHGVATAWRYANTELYSVAVTDKPECFSSWKQYCQHVLEMYPPEEKDLVTEGVNTLIRRHNNQSKLPLQEEMPDPITGCSWKFLTKIALRGDYKGRVAQNMSMECEKYYGNDSLCERIKKYGTDHYIAEKLQYYTNRGLTAPDNTPDLTHLLNS